MGPGSTATLGDSILPSLCTVGPGLGSGWRIRELAEGAMSRCRQEMK